MHVFITDLFTGKCELTGKEAVECVRVRFTDTEPEAVIAANQLIRILWFRKNLLSKQSDQPLLGEQP